jgi:hypothetical protein
VQIAEDGIVFKKMGESFGVGEVVDGNDLYIFVGERGAQYVAADAPETINANLYRHGASGWKILNDGS